MAKLAIDRELRLYYVFYFQRTSIEFPISYVHAWTITKKKTCMDYNLDILDFPKP